MKRLLLLFTLAVLFLSCEKDNAVVQQEIPSKKKNNHPHSEVSSNSTVYAVLYNAEIHDPIKVVYLDDSGMYPVMDTVEVWNREFKSYLDQIDSIYYQSNYQWQIQMDYLGNVQMRKVDLNIVPMKANK